MKTRRLPARRHLHQDVNVSSQIKAAAALQHFFDCAAQIARTHTHTRQAITLQPERTRKHQLPASARASEASYINLLHSLQFLLNISDFPKRKGLKMKKYDSKSSSEDLKLGQEHARRLKIKPNFGAFVCVSERLQHVQMKHTQQHPGSPGNVVCAASEQRRPL